MKFFVTGTDTGVGKTHVTALLLAELRRQGLPAGAMKPIACGRDGRGDAERYAGLMSNEVPLDVLNPIHLHHPLAPSVAARLERRRVHLRRIVAAYQLLAARYNPLFVEGAGGLMVPIRKGYFIADLARDLDLPLLIVARLGLGTINHTLLTIRQAQAMGLKVAGIILNDTTGRRGLAERTNMKVIPQLTGIPLLGVVPHGKPGKAARHICRQLPAVTSSGMA
jgi:dethiobiotin synthetase